MIGALFFGGKMLFTNRVDLAPTLRYLNGRRPSALLERFLLRFESRPQQTRRRYFTDVEDKPQERRRQFRVERSRSSATARSPTTDGVIPRKIRRR